MLYENVNTILANDVDLFRLFPNRSCPNDTSGSEPVASLAFYSSLSGTPFSRGLEPSTFKPRNFKIQKLLKNLTF